MTNEPLATVRAVRAAEADALTWSSADRAQVIRVMPDHLHPVDTAPWVIAVAFARRDDETPVQAADRLALYLTLHRERYGKAPRLQTTARHLHATN